MEKENVDYVDVNYADIDKELIYRTSEVAEIIEENESTIRFWCESFSEYIHIERDGRNRKFTKENIDDLAYTKHLLKKERLTIKQAQERWKEIKSNTSLNINKNTQVASIEKKSTQDDILLDDKVLLQLEEIKSQFMKDISTQINSTIAEQIGIALNIQKQALDNAKLDIKDYIATTVEDKLDTNISNLKAQMDTTIKNTTEELIQQIHDKDVELVNDLKKHMEERKHQNDEESKKGFFSRLFRK